MCTCKSPSGVTCCPPVRRQQYLFLTSFRSTENKTRIIKMTSLDGEYMLLGRRSDDATNIFVQYGQGATRTVNATGGPGVQEAEFIDGLRFSIQSTVPFTMNVDIPNGLDPATMPGNAMSLSVFRAASPLHARPR